MLRLLSLDLTNIGPFDHAHLDFAAEAEPRVTILTGENGTGKSIVIDAIRGMFGQAYSSLERNITRKETSFQVSAKLQTTAGVLDLVFHNLSGLHFFDQSSVGAQIWNLPYKKPLDRKKSNFVLDYWRSGIGADSYEISALARPNTDSFLQGSLQGSHRNSQLTELLCYFDCIRDSRLPSEQQQGEVLYKKASQIIKLSLLDGGDLVGIERSTLTPLLKQAGKTVPRANLSSGNAYLIQRLIGLLGHMYSAHVLQGTDPSRHFQLDELIALMKEEVA